MRAGAFLAAAFFGAAFFTAFLAAAFFAGAAFFFTAFLAAAFFGAAFLAAPTLALTAFTAAAAFFLAPATAFLTALPVSDFSAFLISALARLIAGAAFFLAAFTTWLALSAMAPPISEALSLTLPAALEMAAVTPLPLLITALLVDETAADTAGLASLARTGTGCARRSARARAQNLP